MLPSSFFAFIYCSRSFNEITLPSKHSYQISHGETQDLPQAWHIFSIVIVYSISAIHFVWFASTDSLLFIVTLASLRLASLSAYSDFNATTAASSPSA